MSKETLFANELVEAHKNGKIDLNTLPKARRAIVDAGVKLPDGLEPPVYTHDFDVVASLVSKHENFDDVPFLERFNAMQKRLRGLAGKPEESGDAFGHVGTNDGNVDGRALEADSDDDGTDPLCPHCQKPFPIPEVVRANHDNYQNYGFTLRHACGKMVRMCLTRTVTAECFVAPDSAQDDFDGRH